MSLTGILTDLLTLPLGLLSTGVGYCVQSYQTQYDPLKENILLIHGSGFNCSEWCVGWLYLRHRYNVFTLNYAGWLSNQHHDSVPEYALKIRQKIQTLIQLYHLTQLHLIGHSLGGLIACYYQIHFADLDHIIIPKVITIASPFQGSPRIKSYQKWCQSLPRRYVDMNVGSDLLTYLNYQVKSETQTKYYCYGSQGDVFVPLKFSWLESTINRKFSYCGHYGIIINPFMWTQLCKDLND